MSLVKATLQRLRSDAPTAQEQTVGEPILVQFNPASLRLTLSNSTEGGQSRGRQRRQFNGLSSTELAFELHFDTADEGTDDAPVSVRTRTAEVEQFVLPDPDGRGRKPPRVRFEWGGPGRDGGICLSGLITSLSVDFDHFSQSGVPLRAKMNVTIQEQDPRYELAQRRGAEAAAAQSPPVPGDPPSGAPGTGGGNGFGAGAGLAAGLGLGAGLGVGLGVSASVGLGGGFGVGFDAGLSAGVALGGESLADFAVRAGVDPSAWRAMAGGFEGTLSLEAGAQVAFSAGVSVGGGLGVRAGAGVEAFAGASLEASFGLAGTAQAGASAPGFLLSAAGGVQAAAASVAIVESEAEQERARRSFGLPPSPVSSAAKGLPAAVARPALGPAGKGTVVARPALPEQNRTRLAAVSPKAGREAPRAPSPPAADPRAQSFGRGVPLRPRVRVSQDGGTADAPVAQSPSAPPWEALPGAPRAGGGALGSGPDRRARACGCAGRCGHGGRRS